MKKWCFVLLLGVMFCLMPLNASFAADGDIYEDINGVQYVEVGGVCLVYYYDGWASQIVIPEKIDGKYVVGVDYDAFYDLPTLKSITLPSSVKFIDEYAFYGCSGLTSINMPGVTTIGESAFSGCTNLSSVSFTAGVTQIGRSAFEGCINLTSASFPKGVSMIGEYSFYECYRLSAVNIPFMTEGSIIGNSAFSYCTSLTTMNIPVGTSTIGEYAFDRNTNLQKVNIPSSVTSIQTGAFTACINLKQIFIPNTVSLIQFFAFDLYPATVTILGYSGSYAESYALQTDIPFRSIENMVFSISWEGGPGAMSMPVSQNVSGGQLLQKPPAPLRGYQTFAGWYTDSALTKAYDFTQPVIESLTLYAKWVPGTYLYFWVDGNTSVVPRQYIKFMEYTQRPTNPVKAGYRFAGWYTDQTYKTEFTFGKLMPYLTVIYAKWEPMTYTVDWVGGPGANDMPKNMTVGPSAIISKPPVPTRGYQTFAGWYTDSALTRTYDFSQPVLSDLTLYAKWISGTYLYFWVDGSTSTVPRQYIKYMEYSKVPAAPTKAGYTFGGWYEDQAYTKPYQFNTLLPYIKVVYAKWNPEGQYSVDWIGGPGANNMPPAQLITQNTLLTKPPVPTRGYQTFAGWYTDSTLTKPYDFNQPVTTNLILYAKWVPGTYLYFWVEGSTSTVPRQYIKYMEYTLKPADPVKEGYTFAGWYTDQTYTTEFAFGKLLPYLVTAYAKFEPIPETVEAPANTLEEAIEEMVPVEPKTTEPVIETPTTEPATTEPLLTEPVSTEPESEPASSEPAPLTTEPTVEESTESSINQ